MIEAPNLDLLRLKDAAKDRNGVWKALVHVITRGRDRLDGTR